MTPLRKLLRGLWNYLREVSGENDYARYCEHALKQGGRPITPEAFYISHLRCKYLRANRCC